MDCILVILIQSKETQNHPVTNAKYHIEATLSENKVHNCTFRGGLSLGLYPQGYRFCTLGRGYIFVPLCQNFYFLYFKANQI